MNDILRPLTPDGMCGWDKHNQLWLWEAEEGGRKVGRIIGDPRGHKCRLCQQGWMLTVESLKDQWYDHDYKEWWHYTCYIRYITLKDRDLFDGALIEAKIRFDGLKEMPSQYWRNDPIWSKRNWYSTKALDQPIEIILGSRKRVYNIEFTSDEAPLKAWQEAAHEFAKEDVTKEFAPKRVLLHALGGDQLKDYVKRLSRVFGLDKREAVPAS